MTERTVVVTGMGVVAPCGIGLDDFWQGLLTEPADGDRQILDWDPQPWFENPKDARRSDRFTQFGLAATAMALEQSGDLKTDPTRIAVLVGTGVGGISTNEEQIVTQHEKGPRRVTPFLVPMMMPNAAAAAISLHHGFQGACECTVTACAAGTHSIGNAFNLIKSNRADVVIAGASESAFTPTAVAGFRNMTALSNTGISRPFDLDRDGFVMSEGAGILILEELNNAKARGAEILGVIAGSANTADAHHITAPSPDGNGAIRCMRLAVEDAGLDPSDIVHVNAHGTSTPLNDSAEAEAMRELFGEQGPIVTSTKGVTGHPLGAAGALEAIALLLSIRHQLIPPTMGHKRMDPELPDMDLVVGEPRSWQPGPSLSNSFGFGGHNGTLVISPFSG